MNHKWIFAGSGFWKDEDTGNENYLAEGGELICVSNFSTATLDLDVQSSQSNEGLLFEAWTERIPPLGTPVRLVLQVAKPNASRKHAPEDPATGDSENIETELRQQDVKPSASESE